MICAPLSAAWAAPLITEEPPQIQVVAGGIGSGWDRYIEYIHCMADRVQTDCASELTIVPLAEKKGEAVAAWVSLDCNGQVTEILELEGREPLVQAVRQVLSAEVAAHHSFGP